MSCSCYCLLEKWIKTNNHLSKKFHPHSKQKVSREQLLKKKCVCNISLVCHHQLYCHYNCFGCLLLLAASIISFLKLLSLGLLRHRGWSGSIENACACKLINTLAPLTWYPQLLYLAECGRKCGSERAARFPLRPIRPISLKFLGLKVGSWSFEGIIILPIYFLNCRKANFYKKVSFSIKYKAKSIRLAVLRTLLRIPVSTIFRKLTTQLSSCCNAFLG